MRGRKPKPTAQKVAAGNPGKRRLNDREPEFSPTAPDPPAELNADARAMWAELSALLGPLRLATAGDRIALAQLCSAWGEFLDATRTLDAEGRYVRSDGGMVRPHPAAAMLRAAWKGLLDGCTRFGLDPSSRSRISTPPPDKPTAEGKGRFFGGK